MTRLRAAYDALQQSSPFAVPPDALIDAMQSGDRLGYHPERAAEEIAHFHDVLPKAQAAVNAIGADSDQRLDRAVERMKEMLKSIGGAQYTNFDPQSARQEILDKLHRAERMVAEASK
jgi:hypothetical protein